MAKGGSGDLLAGITASNVAQGMSPLDAAITVFMSIPLREMPLQKDIQNTV